MDDADRIWNRATEGGGADPRPGDAALTAALSFHGLAMNGGVLHAFEVLSAEELGRARDGFAWLELTGVSRFLETTAQTVAATDWDDDDAVDSLETTTDEGYEAVLPDDHALEIAFRRRLADDPAAFGPV